MVYGESAQGEFRRGSDIDLCVMTSLLFANILQLYTKLNTLDIPISVDVVVFDRLQSTTLIEGIKTEGRPLVDNAPQN